MSDSPPPIPPELPQNSPTEPSRSEQKSEQQLNASGAEKDVSAQASGVPGGLIIPPSLPANVAQNPALLAAAITISQQQQSLWQAPLPPPEAAERYEAILPGSFDRVLKMAEDSLAAQIQTQKAAQKNHARTVTTGQILGFLTAFGSMVCCIVSVYMKANGLVSGAFLGVPILAVAKSLIESSHGKSASPKPSPSTPADSVPQTNQPQADTPKPGQP